MSGVFLKLRAVTRRYDGRAVVDRLSLEVGEGEVVILRGASGCGKTTTLRMIAGLETPDEGEVWIGGVRVAADGRSIVPPSRRVVGFVFQDLALWPHLTVAGNLDFVISSAKVPRRERAERINETLRMVRIDRFAQSYPHQLSGGEQQRVALARALIARPRLLLLDEPMAHLDADLKAELLKEVSALQRALGVTTIYVTHDIEEALAVNDRVVKMRDGRIENGVRSERL
jgi:ABC-type Fe3+/spermidine/putrescine transport system ATPase subunit